VFIGDYFLADNLYSVGADLVSPNLDTLWNRLKWGSWIAQVAGNKSGHNVSDYNTNLDTISAKFSGNSAIVTAIQNALGSGLFVLGMRASTEPDYYPYSYTWNVNNNSMKLKIYFRTPHQTVTVDQKLNDNTSYGSVGHYEGNTFIPYQAPHPFSFPLDSIQWLNME
jgi:hypothetical protein